MADANIYVLNPFFQTRSFDDMVKPLAMYAQAYKEQEAKVEDMTDKASALEWIANQNPDSQTAALYRDMSDKIKGIRDDMMMNGLTGGLRSRILGTRRIYSANSSEITRRYEDMVKYKDRMAALQDKDPSMVFSADSWDVGIDDFAGGKRPKIKAISGNEIMARGAAVGKRLTSQIFGDGVLGQEMGGQFWKYYQEQGMTDKALYDWLHHNGMDDKYQMAKDVINGVYDSFKDFSPADQFTLKNRFMEGIYSGAVYNRQVSYQQNMNFESDAARDTRLFNKRMSLNQDRRAQQEHDAQMVAAGWIPDGKGGYQPTAAAIGYGGKGKGAGSSSGSGSDSNSRVPEMRAMYMTGDDEDWLTAGNSNGIPINADGNAVDKGLSVSFRPSEDGSKLEVYNGKTVLATYDIDSDKITKSDKKYGKHDRKLLKHLCKKAIDTVVRSGGDYRVLNNYDAKFNSDNNQFWGDHNGSAYFAPVERVMPTNNDGTVIFDAGSITAH